MDGKGKDVRGKWQSPAQVMADILGASSQDKVVVALGDWVERRRMMVKGSDIKFEQVREADGEWLVAEFLEPNPVDNWAWVVKNAWDLKLAAPETAWIGPIENIPAELLLSDVPLNVRRVDKSGWIALRSAAKEACEVKA